ncbi:penicillin acylase family protein [Winogradskya consettensis]|uniref:Penicillin amidase n=2 Tax=Winogradskya consettensis TaxID=113560 RepID=A0A919VJ19_9ACTN|nr:penicillin amidase [Actinoplanes consettensis]
MPLARENGGGMTDVIAKPVQGTSPDAPAVVPSRRHRILRRWRLAAWFTVATLVVVVAGAGLTATWLVRRSLPQYTGTLAVPGLSGPVRVVRDGLGVPQIYAGTPHDLFLAQGYVAAQDRFWEMDIRRHITAGRLAELFGEGQVETDAMIRTMGWRRVAEQEVTMLSPQSRAHLDAYAAGVNAYLKDHSGWSLSAEYGLLGLTTEVPAPEPWTPADSLSWLKAMAWDLNGSMSDQIRRSLMSATLTQEQVDELFPDYDYQRWPTTIAAGASTGGAGGGSGQAFTDEQLGAVGSSAQGATAIDGVLGERGRSIGSNAWAVAGSRTTTGKPLLANDPHLAASQPGVWYQSGLHCEKVTAGCPYDVAGFGFAGLPGIVIGHNANVTWGFTNLGPADTDLFLEKITGGTYEYRGAQVPLTTRTEVIKIAGGEPRTITVRATRHGPIISDVYDRVKQAGDAGREPGIAPAPGGYAVALQWTALDPHPTLDAVFALDTATDWTSFRAAAAKFSVPSQNLVYADTAGHIGYQAPGLIPVRAKGDGTAPVPGWTGEYDWTGYLPFDDMPTQLDPPSGYIVSANNAVVGPEYPHHITSVWGDGYRAARITKLIEDAGKLDAAAMRRIQLDTHNGNAEDLVPRLLAVTPGEGARKAQALLRDWNFDQPVDSAAAAYFNAVWDRMLELTFEARFAGTPYGKGPDGGGLWYEIVRKMLAQPDSMWWQNTTDPRGLRTRDDVLIAAMNDAAATLSGKLGTDPAQWRWGDLHQLTLRNQTLGTGGPAPVQWLLNSGPFEVPGGTAAVDATGWDAREGYEVNWVPSMRMVVDLSNLDASTWVNLTGVSGHAADEHYDDQTALWRTGRTAPWAFTRSAVDAATEDELTLTPGS